VDYFATKAGNGNSAGSGSSGSSTRENSFGAMGALPERSQERETKDPDDLIRRGSVDERTMTMGRNVRLFVANPDPN
jgi:hypothetical protein